MRKTTSRQAPEPDNGVRASAAQLEVFHRQLFLPLVWRATYKHGLPKEDARDIVQEAFLLAVAKLRSNGNPKAWLIHVVDNLALNHNRKSRRRARLAAKWGISSGPTREDREAG